MRYLLLLVAIAGLAACQKQEAQPESRPETARQSELPPEVDEGPKPAPDTHVTWARATAEGQSDAAVYAVIHNHHGGTDQLVGADTGRARVALLQAVEPVNGLARTRQVQSLELKAGHGMELKPGGNQIMLKGLSSPLKAGERFPMTLHFKRSGDQEVRVVVVPPGASAPDEY